MYALTRHGARRGFTLAPAILLATALLGGCGSLDSARKLIDPYKNDVVQGNFVSREQVEFIKPGMTRQQVRDVLGTPLVASVFMRTAGTMSSRSSGAASNCSATA